MSNNLYMGSEGRMRAHCNFSIMLEFLEFLEFLNFRISRSSEFSRFSRFSCILTCVIENETKSRWKQSKTDHECK